MLEDVSLTINEREFVCILGPNGGGKTTLLKLMLGLLHPTKGRVRVRGLAPRQARRHMGYVPQGFQYDPQFPVRVIDVVLMGRLDRTRRVGPYRLSDRQAAFDALRHVELLELRDHPVSSLSGGQRQRALIARALASEPEILLLDEPTASLDLAAEARLYELLDRMRDRLTMVMVSHDVGFVSRRITKVICVRHQVAVHPTSEITGEIIAEMYGSDIRMVRHEHSESGGQGDA